MLLKALFLLALLSASASLSLAAPRSEASVAAPLSSLQGSSEIFLSGRTAWAHQPASTIVGVLAVEADISSTFTLAEGEGSDGNYLFVIQERWLRTARQLTESDAGTHSVRVRATDGAGDWIEEVFAIEVAVFAGGGQLHLDPSFDAGSAFNGPVRALLRQADGKWIVGGSFTTVHGEVRGNIARLNPDGSTDHSFAGGGAGANGPVLALAGQSDGRILVGGGFTTINGESRGRIARLEPDGTIDPTFIGEVYPGGVSIPDVRAITVENDGRIIIGGNFFSVNGNLRTRIARLMPNGGLDLSFAHLLPGANAPVQTLALHENGMVIVGGTFDRFHNQTRQGIVRLKPDGALDPDFTAQTDGEVFVVRTAGDGRILVGGEFTVMNGQPRSRIARLHADGSLDPDFGSLGTGPGGRVDDIDLLEDGRLLISGAFSSVDDLPRGRVARLLEDGSLDQNFADGLAGANSAVSVIRADGEAGVVLGGFFTEPRRRIARLRADGTLDPDFFNGPGGPTHFIDAILPQDDGRVLIAGSLISVQDIPRGRIARLHEDGRLDREFAEGLIGANSVVHALAGQPDGRILIAGSFTEVHGEPRNRIARLLPDGSLDPSFAATLSLANGVIRALALESSGKILIGGTFTEVNGVTRNRIARLNPDGSLDTGFGHGMSGANESVSTIALTPGEGIFIGGAFSHVNSLPRARIARLDRNGSLNNQFQPVSVESAGVNAIGLQPDGKIVIGGGFTRVGGQPRDRLARLLPNGQLDTAFFAEEPGFNGIVYAILVQPDGRILVGGQFSNVYNWRRNGFARLHADGSLDLALEGASGQSVRAIALQPDGNILIGGGFATVNDIPRERVARLFGGPAPWNEPPGDILLSGNSIREYRHAGTLVGLLTAVDPNEDDVHIFSLVPGEGDSGNERFVIRGNRLETAGPLVREEAASYSIRVRATDAGLLMIERVLQIEVDPNLPPTGIELDSLSVVDLRPAGTAVGTLTAIDPDDGDEHAFALVPGEGDTDNALFVIDGDILRTAAVLDFYEQSTYSIRIQTMDLGGLTAEEIFTITLLQEGYRAWAHALPEAKRNPMDDALDVGTANLLRYAFGMEPLALDLEKLPRADVVVLARPSGGSPISHYLTLTYIRRTDDPALSYTIEASANLVTWTQLPAFPRVIFRGPGWERVVFTDHQAIEQTEHRFLRIRVR